MEQQHRDLRYPTVNFHRSMYLYDQPGSASRGSANYNFRAVRYDDLERALDAKQFIAGSPGSSAPAGYYSAGQAAIPNHRAGTSKAYNLFKPLPSIQPQIDAYKRQQEESQAELKAQYERQLKVLQIENTKLKEQEDPVIELPETPDYASIIAKSNQELSQRFDKMMVGNQQSAAARADQYQSTFDQISAGQTAQAEYFRQSSQAQAKAQGDILSSIQSASDKAQASAQAQSAAQSAYYNKAEEERKQLKISQRTSLANQARSSLQAKYRLGGESGMKRGGTFGFRRRNRPTMGGITSNTASSAGSLNV